MFKRNKTAIFFSFLIGLIFISPHILIPAFLGDKNYYPQVVENVPLEIYDETYCYGAVVKEVLEGKLFSFSPSSAEHKNRLNFRDISFRIPIFLVSFICWTFGSIKNGFIFCDFLFPALNFLVFYMLALKLSGNSKVSIVSATTAITMTRIFSSYSSINDPGYILKTITSIDPTAPLFYMRLVSPQITTIFGFGTAVLLYSALEKPEVKRLVMAGFSMGLLAYCYIYYAVLFPLMTIFLTLLFFIKKENNRFSASLAILTISSVVMTPLALSFFMTDKSVLFSTANRFTYSEPLHPMFSLGIVFVIVLMYFTFRSKYFPLYFTSSFFLSSLLWINSPRIFPGIPQVFHFVNHCVEPLFYITAIISLHHFISNRGTFLKKHSDTTIAIVLVLVLFVGGFRQYKFSEKFWSSFTLEPELINVFTWMDKNIAKDSVILAYDVSINELIPVYTWMDIFDPRPNLIFADSNELDERFMISLATIDTDKQSLMNTSEEIWKYHYLSIPAAKREHIVSDFIKKYDKSDKSKLIDKINTQYRLDYLLLSPHENIYEKRIQKQLGIQEVYFSGGYKVFRVSLTKPESENFPDPKK